ncbi:PhzF family phenazine biosynthesis protein [Mesorhizobium sp. L-8-3]|uniref:PhzF family phenazine biosynthesis protein n=1 Tax=Mesorhizobium sp. L-8-3 TaxID=2744522 RepID=UPI001928F8E8|nr:PhzF family phenazine biosynthesis protein [Mesorhizobium sp. L-8-3]BCH24280.1 isomerase [Mesorhizobium sp. L-8-3]
MPKRRYAVYDVFTDKVLAGNPLAVVFEAEGLDDAAMQRIAGEFNLSETSFVLPPVNPRHRANVRIFTPHYEMPFAGHPTVGTAIALAEAAAEAGERGTGILVLEEKVGPIRCAVKQDGGPAFAEFDLPRLPEQLPLSAEPDAIGAALGLDSQEIGFENHRVGLWSGGVPYITVPVASLAAAGRAVLDGSAWLDLAPTRDNGAPACAYVYTRETVGKDSAFHARMFVPGSPGYEDPATGSAAAAFAGVIHHFDRPVDGPARYWIEQGIEMGRPSRIRLELDIEGGGIAAARIGGNAVRIAEGSLFA